MVNISWRRSARDDQVHAFRVDQVAEPRSFLVAICSHSVRCCVGGTTGWYTNPGGRSGLTVTGTPCSHRPHLSTPNENPGPADYAASPTSPGEALASASATATAKMTGRCPAPDLLRRHAGPRPRVRPSIAIACLA